MTSDTALWDILDRHIGHDVELVRYGDGDTVADVCLECLTCNEVLLSAEHYTLAPRSDDPECPPTAEDMAYETADDLEEEEE